jgi:hypothetical protein
MTFRRQYWCCTKFADYLRGTPKPEAETSEGWEEWEIKAKMAHKFRFWLAEEFIDRFQDFINLPLDIFNNIQGWIRNVMGKTHVLYHPSMKLGSWHELDYKIVHCNFQALVDFIEIEKAWMMTKKENKNRWKRGRCPQLGLEHLEWEINLKMDEDWGIKKDDPEYGNLTPQAKSATEQLALYNWWVNERPKRIDVYESPYYDEIKEKFGDEYYSEINRIENMYYDEDTEMLIRLIKIRNFLWV